MDGRVGECFNEGKSKAGDATLNINVLPSIYDSFVFLMTSTFTK